MKRKQKSAPSPEEWAETQRTKDPEVLELKRRLRVAEKTIQRFRTGQELIVEAVRAALEELPPIVPPPAPTRPKHARALEEIAVAHISDVQLGKVTPSYDSEIARERIMLFAAKVAEITEIRRSAATIRELRLYLGGDIIEGEDVFATQAHQIDSSVFDQAVRTAPLALAAAITLLLGSFERVCVSTVPGNHGRNGPHGGRAHPRTNWDNVVYETTRLLVERPETRGRLTWTQSESFWLVDRVYDWGLLLVHGDQITGGFAGFPWYGTAKKAWGWIDAIPAPWDYLLFGHFHQHACAVLNLRTFLANGTTESDNEYAQAQLAAAGVPSQRLSFFNAKHGLIADHQVFLAERVPARQRSTTWRS